MNLDDIEIKQHSNKGDLPIYNIQWEAPEDNSDEYTWMGTDYVILPDNWEND